MSVSVSNRQSEVRRRDSETIGSIYINGEIVRDVNPSIRRSRASFGKLAALYESPA